MSAYRAMYHTEVVLARLELIHLTQDWSELPNCAIRVGMARMEDAKIGGITPLILIFSGR